VARYNGRTACAAVLVSALLTGASVGALASSDYERCHREVQQISGYYGQESRGVIGSGLGGGLRGAAAGAATGWVAGTDSRKAAMRGAALGVVIGGVEAAAENSVVSEHLLRVRDYCAANPDSPVVDAFVAALK
jgi:hypothetical protein